MKKKLAVFLGLVLPVVLSAYKSASGQSVSGCRQNITAAAAAPYRWEPASEAHIVFARGDFKKSELAALNNALIAWQQELSRMGINIKLTNDGEDSFGKEQRNSILVRRKNELPSGRQAQFTALAGANGYFTSGEIAIKSGINKSNQLNRLMQHELGHAFGLMDCPACRYGATIMNMHSVAINSISIGKMFGREQLALTPCDQQTLTIGYQMEAASGATIPAGSVIGEDEVEDVVTSKDLDTTAPETGDGKTLIESADYSSAEPSAAKQQLIETLFFSENANTQSLSNYSFKRDVIIETVGLGDKVTGSYHRLSQFVFDDAGMRIEKVISFPKPNLKHLIITREDIKDLAGAQLLGLEPGKMDLYRVLPAGRDAQTGQLVFRVLPRDLLQAKATGERVFYGTAWVDEATMKIVRVKGRALPEGNQRFPMFETERGQIAQGLWAPVSTFADDILIFPNRQIRMRIKVRYFDYRQFRSKVTITEVDSR